MKKPKSAKSEVLETLHAKLAETLTTRIRKGDADAAVLSVARAFLKDNHIEVSDPTTLRDLEGAVTDDTLPFPSEPEEALPQKAKRA